MATSGYVGEIQSPAQPQSTSVTVTPGQTDAISTPAIASQFLAEIQTTVTTPTVVTPTGQTPPPEQATSIAAQKPAPGTQAPSTAQTQPAQTQYVTAEIQGSPVQSGGAQSAPQYIVVTVTGKQWWSGAIMFLHTQLSAKYKSGYLHIYIIHLCCPDSVHAFNSSEGSLHSNDSVSDSSSPPAVVQTGVPTQVVQQVQTAQQVKHHSITLTKSNHCSFPWNYSDSCFVCLFLSKQRSVVQATSQIAKTEPGTQLSVTSLQPVHISQEVSQRTPLWTSVYFGFYSPAIYICDQLCQLPATPLQGHRVSEDWQSTNMAEYVWYYSLTKTGT